VWLSWVEIGWTLGVGKLDVGLGPLVENGVAYHWATCGEWSGISLGHLWRMEWHIIESLVENGIAHHWALNGWNKLLLLYEDIYFNLFYRMGIFNKWTSSSSTIC